MGGGGGGGGGHLKVKLCYRLHCSDSKLNSKESNGLSYTVKNMIAIDFALIEEDNSPFPRQTIIAHQSKLRFYLRAVQSSHLL